MNNRRILIETAPRTIECLCCGAERIMNGHDAGECSCCHYVGWTYSDELDGFTRRMIESRAFGVAQPVAPPHRRGLGSPGIAA